MKSLTYLILKEAANSVVCFHIMVFGGLLLGVTITITSVNSISFGSEFM